MNVIRTLKPLVPPSLRSSLYFLSERSAMMMNFLDHYINGNRVAPAYTGIRSQTSPKEREFLFSTSQLDLPNNTAVELGVYLGGSIPFFGNRFVYGIDFFEDCPMNHPDGSPYPARKTKEEVDARLRELGFSKFELIKGDTKEAGQNWRNGKIGMLFVDADHRTPVKDFLSFLPNMEEGSYVIWHDSALHYGGNGRKDTSAKLKEFLDHHSYIFDASENSTCDSMVRRRVVSPEFVGDINDLPEFF